MNYFKIKSYCKINLNLRILKKLNNGYHNILSLITFSKLHDIITISEIKGPKDKISFSGKFKKGISKEHNTISKVLDSLRKLKLIRNFFFKINVKKNIPHGSGLGGGSSNAAHLLNYLNFKMKLKLSEQKLKKLAYKIGSDVPIILKRQNTFLTGRQGKMLRFKKNFNLNLLLVYPNLNCSTKEIYRKNKTKSLLKIQPYFYKNKKNLINFLIKDKNDLQKTVVSIYPKIGKIINFIETQEGCYFSRITGSGSACIGIFSNMTKAIYAQKLIKLKYPTYWCVVSKTI